MAKSPKRKWLYVFGASALLLIAASESAQWAASADPRVARSTGDCAVLVLGYPAAGDGSATEAQRLRVDAGVRAVRRFGCDLIVLSGAAVRNRFAEADVMAALASRELANRPVQIVREKAARNTWENIRYSLPMLRAYGRTFIASEGLHAQRGRRYLCRQDPSRCGSTFVSAADRPWRMLPYRVASSIYELRAWVRDSLFY